MTDANVRALMALARAQATEAEPFGSLPGPLNKASGSEQMVINDLTAWFASTASVPGQELPYRLIAELMDLGIPHRAAVEAGRLAMPPPVTGRTRYGSPTSRDGMSAARRVAAQEPGMRAQFVLASARRLAEAITDDRLTAQLADEQRFRDMHVAMGRKRRQAARQVDDAAGKSRDGWMVWRCGDHPEARCAALRNRLFTVNNMPGIPGAMHLNCECWSEPWGGISPGPS